MQTKDRIILALDGLSLKDAIRLAAHTCDMVYGFKLHHLLDEYGAPYVREMFQKTEDIDPILFGDYKLHDIPGTVALRARALSEHVEIITVHADGGVDMVRAAVNTGVDIYAVTKLTSLEQADVPLPLPSEVLRLARIALIGGARGIVCSSQELKMLSSRGEFREMEFIVPGTRSIGAETHDQKRTDTPYNAIRNGATRLVIGRQFTEAPDPVVALKELHPEIEQAVKDSGDMIRRVV